MRTHCEHGTILLSVIFRIFLGATEKSGTADREPELLHSKGWKQGFPGGSGGKESACSVGDLGSIPGSGRTPGTRARRSTPVFLPGEALWTVKPEGAAVHGVTKS